MKRWISSIIAAVMMFAALVPAVQGAEAGKAPEIVNANNYSSPVVTLVFDQRLQESNSLDVTKFSIGGVTGAKVTQALTSYSFLTLILNVPLDEVDAVTVNIAAGAVSSYTGTPIAEVTGYKVQTLAGIVGILEAMDAKTVNPDISHVAKYLRSSGADNIVAGAGVDRADARFLMSLIGANEANQTWWVDNQVSSAESALSYAHFETPEKAELKDRLAAAKSVRQAAGSTLYQLSVATLELTRAYHQFILKGHISMDPVLYRAAGANADVEPVTEQDAASNSLYVPAGMTAAQLMDEITSRYSFAVRNSSATDAIVVAGNTQLAPGMVVRIEAEDSKLYEIKLQKAVTNISELKAALSNAELSAIRIANDISAPTENLQVTGKLLKAHSDVRLEVRNFTFGHPSSKYGNITLVGHAANDEDLQALTGNAWLDEIVADGIGTLVAQRDWLSGKFYFAMGSTAYVGNPQHLLDALAAEAIGKVYLVADVTVAANVPLTFPERSVSLVASTPRVLKANATNELNGTFTNVTLVEDTSQPGGFWAYIDDLVVDNEGWLQQFNVHFSEPLSQETLAKIGAADLLEHVTFIYADSEGIETNVWTPNMVNTTWMDNQTLKIALQDGAEGNWHSVTVGFINGAIKGTTDPNTWLNTVTYGAEPIFPTIGNVQTNDGQLQSFDIVFSSALHASTLGRLTAAELIAEAELFRDAETGWESLAISGVEWIGDDTLRVSVPEGYGEDYYLIQVKLLADAIQGKRGGDLITDTAIHYNEHASFLFGEITRAGTIEAVNIEIQFSEPVSGETLDLLATGPQLLLESVMIDGMSWTADDVDMEMNVSFDVDDSSILNIHFAPQTMLSPVPSRVEVHFIENAVTGQSGGILLNNPIVYQTDYEYFGAEIENITFNVSRDVETFDLRFSKALSEETLGMSDAADIFEIIEAYGVIESYDNAQLENVDIAWDESDHQVLHVNLNGELQLDAWRSIYIRLLDSIMAEDGTWLDNTWIEYEYVPDPGEVEVSSKYEEIYVPYGTTVAELVNDLKANGYPDAVLFDDNADDPNDEELAKSPMAIDLNDKDTDEFRYPIFVHGVAASMDDVMYWIADTDVDVVTLKAGFTTDGGETLHISRPIRLRAAESIDLYVGDLQLWNDVTAADFITYEEVTVIGSVFTDEQIRHFVNTYDVTHLLSEITGYEGLYVRNAQAEKHHYVIVNDEDDNKAAIVYNAASLEDALLDESVTRIFVADNIGWPAGETLSIPSRITHLKSLEGHTISADTFAFYSNLIWSETITLDGEHVVTDITPPVISGVHVNTMTNTVTVFVDDPAATVYIVEDGTVITDVSQLTEDLRSEPVSTDSAVFSDFYSENAPYYYRAYAVDAAGNLSEISALIEYIPSA